MRNKLERATTQDENNRLRAENERLQGIEAAALQAAGIYEAEITRLRGALTKIRDDAYERSDFHATSGPEMVWQTVAHRALVEQTSPQEESEACQIPAPDCRQHYGADHCFRCGAPLDRL